MANKNINAFDEKTTITDGDFVVLWDTAGADTNKQDVATLRRPEIRSVVGSGTQSGAGASDLHIALEHASATNYTITGAPTIGDTLSVIVDTTAAHTIVLSGSVTFDGSNKTANLATALDSFIAVARTATRWDIVSNNGVTLSA